VVNNVATAGDGDVSASREMFAGGRACTVIGQPGVLSSAAVPAVSRQKVPEAVTRRRTAGAREYYKSIVQIYCTKRTPVGRPPMIDRAS
jgi:hypothetical protein